MRIFVGKNTQSGFELFQQKGNEKLKEDLENENKKGVQP